MLWNKYKAPPPTLQVMFGEVQVAELRREKTSEGDEYVFFYLPPFKELGLLPLPGLPILEREYRSKELWPYFAERIPSLSRPEIQEWIRANRINKYDELQLLAELGAKSITDPFEIRRAA